MKKLIIGLLAALATMILIGFLNEYILKWKITDYLTGWICCTSYFASIEIYENKYFNP